MNRQEKMNYELWNNYKELYKTRQIIYLKFTQS